MKIKMNRLRNQRGYLCGPMDHAPDAGVGWRKRLREDTSFMDIAWLDPCNKPCDFGQEGPEEVRLGRELMENERYEEATTMFTEVRAIDLRMVDLSDFIVVRLDFDIPSCGTHEEWVRANSQNKPVLLWMVQGKKHVPRWLIGAIPQEMIFSSYEGLYDYLAHIAYDDVIDTMGRWMFFDIKNGA